MNKFFYSSKYNEFFSNLLFEKLYKNCFSKQISNAFLDGKFSL